MLFGVVLGWRCVAVPLEGLAGYWRMAWMQSGGGRCICIIAYVRALHLFALPAIA